MLSISFASGFDMADTSQQSGEKSLIATLPTPTGEQRIYMPTKGIEEIFCDGVAGLLVNGAVAKLDLYSIEVNYDLVGSAPVIKENRVLNYRLVIPVPNLLDLFAGFINSIDFDTIDNKYGSLHSKLEAIADAASNKAGKND